jgi:uncharacterized protein (DUF58 family)
MEKNLQKLLIRARKSVKGLLHGLWNSHYRGRGIAFEELRPYQPGDPVSDISWSHLAAWNKALIKRYNEERDLKIWILFDVSPSIEALGDERRERMSEISSLIALVALNQRDRVGLLFFSDKLEKLILPRRGIGSAPLILAELNRLKGSGKGTNWEIPFSYLQKIDPQGGAILFLVSDFATLPKEVSLLRISERREIVGVFAEEFLDIQPPPAGSIALEDAETGESVIFDSTSSYQRDYEDSVEQRRSDIKRLFGKIGGSFLNLPYGVDASTALGNFLSKPR